MTKKTPKITSAGTTELSEDQLLRVQGGAAKTSKTKADSFAQTSGGSANDTVPVDQFSFNYEKIRS